MVWIILLFFVNLFISWSNAYGAGKNMRTELSGFAWLLNWSAIIMSACGFTWCYTIAMAGIGYAAGQLDAEQVDLALKIGYIVIVPSVIGSGFIITIHSWIRFYKSPGLGNGATVAWNTYAQVSNTMNAVRFFPEALGDVLKAFDSGGKKSSSSSDDNGQGKAALIALVLVIFALCLGVFTTRYIVLSAKHSAVKA